jgi:hypothetical protein
VPQPMLRTPNRVRDNLSCIATLTCAELGHRALQRSQPHEGYLRLVTGSITLEMVSSQILSAEVRIWLGCKYCILAFWLQWMSHIGHKLSEASRHSISIASRILMLLRSVQRKAGRHGSFMSIFCSRGEVLTFGFHGSWKLRLHGRGPFYDSLHAFILVLN